MQIQTDQLLKSYDGMAVVKSVGFDVRPGRIVGLLGPAGSGKTTILQMLLGITTPDKGVIHFDDQPLSRDQLDRIGYLPEMRGVYSDDTLNNILIYFARLKGLSRKKAAVEAVRFKDRFLASAAHDLKQPVNALGIYAEWLASEPELAHELSLKILKSTQSVNALFDSLFDFVRLDAGKMQVRQRTIKLAELFDDLEVQFRPTALEKSLNLRVRPKAWTLHTDPIMLQRILSNLLANAMRYTSHGGVLLAVRPWRGGLRLEVWDTGIGVAENQLGHIFAEFYKVQSAGTQEGFGLGLAIVKRLTEALGYELQVRSHEGRGTLFRITLPPDAVVAAPELRTTATRASGRSAASVSGS